MDFKKNNSAKSAGVFECNMCARHRDHTKYIYGPRFWQKYLYSTHFTDLLIAACISDSRVPTLSNPFSAGGHTCAKLLSSVLRLDSAACVNLIVDTDSFSNSATCIDIVGALIFPTFLAIQQLAQLYIHQTWPPE